jgi:hypothetical protein
MKAIRISIRDDYLVWPFVEGASSAIRLEFAGLGGINNRDCW